LKIRVQTPPVISREVGDGLFQKAAQIEALFSSFACIYMRLTAIGCRSEELRTLLDFPRLAIPAPNCLRALSPGAEGSPVASAPRCSSTTRDSRRDEQGISPSIQAAQQALPLSSRQATSYRTISLSIRYFALNRANMLLVEEIEC